SLVRPLQLLIKYSKFSMASKFQQFFGIERRRLRHVPGLHPEGTTCIRQQSINTSMGRPLSPSLEYFKMPRALASCGHLRPVRPPTIIATALHRNPWREVITLRNHKNDQHQQPLTDAE
ncbi:MAG TPA: hypothetical protein VHE33_01940, partial [Acidobacteriaceae bacterium]|nr:hypothetical protein [Acidobacteriaceae bacterium]